MKRRRDEGQEDPSKKRRKVYESDVFDDESLNSCLCNVDNATSPVGHLKGSVTMIWNNIPRKRIISVNVKCRVSTAKVHKISVTFEGDWIDLLEAERGEIGIWDDIQISLDGVSSIKSADGRSQTDKLIYKEGVIVQWKCSKEGKKHFANTWQLQEEKAGKEQNENLDDWFATPAQPVTSRLSEIARRISTGRGTDSSHWQEENGPKPETAADAGPVEGQRKEVSEATRKVPAIENPISMGTVVAHESGSSKSNGATQVAAASVEPLQAKEALPEEPRDRPPGSRKAEKRRKKKERAAALAGITAKTPAQRPVEKATAVPNTPRVAIDVLQTPTATCERAQVIELGSRPIVETGDDTPVSWMARLRCREPDYRPLKDAKAGTLTSMIGFISDAKPRTRTRTGDWSTTVRVRDPSIIEDSDFSINFFYKRFPEWLPPATSGDILIVRGIRLQEWEGKISGVGYHDKAKWAIFSISQGCILQPERGDAPEAQVLADGGVTFSPFLKPTEEEIRYCIRLSDWWKERQKNSTGQVHNVGGDGTITPRYSFRRHLLLSEAGPHVEPGGYFDCTIEVLKGYMNDNGVYTLYATDYTRNSETSICQAKWCPAGLNDFVVQFELWDGAAALGASFETGSYIAVRNARMVQSRGGYLEGKIVQKKMAKLDPEDDNERLKALLRRKKEWEERNVDKRAAFAHKLIEDAQDSQLFSCTVELLRVTKSYDEVYFYVTDYTSHPELSSDSYGEWSKGLEGFVVPILLRDRQSQYADNCRVGTFLSIQNLRLKYHTVVGRFQGELGGSDPLINPANPKGDVLQALKERKSKWEGEENGRGSISERPGQNSGPGDPLQTSEFPNKPGYTIKEIKACTKQLTKLRVFARVVDFYPLHLRQCLRAWCSQCKQDIPDGKQACHKCADLDHEFVRYKFGIGLRIEDRNGDQIEVAMADECDLLRGLERGDPWSKPDILPKFAKRLEPLLGNLSDVHEKMARGQPSEANSDFHSLIVGRYKDAEGRQMHILLGAENYIMAEL